jgi:hypothetical protein
VEGIPNPQVKGTLLPAGNRHTLTATSSNHCRWFESDTAQLPVASGSEFTTPLLTHSTTFYVQAFGSGAEQTVGKIENENERYGSNDGNVYFTVYKPIYIKSVRVYAQRGRFKFFIRNADAIILRQFTVEGDSIPYGPMNIDIDMQLAPGHYYFDYFSNTDMSDPWFYNLGIDPEGASFPYKIDGLISIDSTDRPPEYYYFFYNWKVQEISCGSERVPVLAAVIGDNGIINEFKSATAPFQVTVTVHNKNATFRIMSPVAMKISAEILAVNGKIVKKFNLQVSRNSVSTYIMSTCNLTAGYYIARIHSEGFQQNFAIPIP